MGGGPEVNKFEQVSSVGHHMSLAEGPGLEGWGLRSGDPCPEGVGQGRNQGWALHNDVQCIIVMVTWDPKKSMR